MTQSEMIPFIEKIVLEQMQGISLQVWILTALAGIVAVHLFILILTRMTDKKIGFMQEFLWCILIAYACFIFQITFYNREPGSRNGVNIAVSMGSIRGGYGNAQRLVYSFLNIVLFHPWGFLLSWINRKRRYGIILFMTTLYCFLTSSMIEISQHLTRRGYLEVTDLITNTLGGVLGSIMACLLLIVYRRIRHKSDISQRSN